MDGNVRETGRGLVIANILFSIPIIWVFVVLADLVCRGLDWAVPVDAPFSYQGADTCQSLIINGAPAVGAIIAQVCFFISRTRPSARTPLWRFRLLTLIGGMLTAAGLMYLNVSRKPMFPQMGTPLNVEYGQGWPRIWYYWKNSSGTLWSPSDLCWDVAYCVTILLMVMLLIECGLARPFKGSSEQ
jgi:hypothetical protein